MAGTNRTGKRVLVNSKANSREGEWAMSDREKASALLDQVPDYQIKVIIAYLQGVIDASSSMLNEDTVEAMKEYDGGIGQRYSGSTADIFASVLAEAD